MLELEAITYHPATSERAILAGLNLQLQLGEPALVAGRSGSGKSSLLDLIAGLASPDAGVIRWEGRATTARQRRWLCGLVFQFPERHFLGLSVAQELRIGHRRLPSEKIEAVLAQVGLAGISLQQAPEQLSGGQQRRLALAVQLLRDPPILLLDEPTAGLDWSVRHNLLDLLVPLGRERLLLVVTHEPEAFEGLSQHQWQLEHGRCLRFTDSSPIHA